MTEFELVSSLRQTIHARSVRGSAARQHDHHRRDFPMSYAGVDNVEDRETMLCGGVAHWLYLTYRSLGFRAFTMNVGSPDGGPSHVMTFVSIAHEGRQIWSMQDAYLNATYVEGDRPVCLTEVYARLASREDDRISVSVSPGPAPVSLKGIESDPRRFEIVTAVAAREGVEIRTPSEEVIQLEWNYHSFPFDPFRRLLQAHFGRGALVLLLALPLGTSNEPYAEEFMRTAEGLYRRLSVR